MTSLCGLPNIGDELQKKLNLAGINSAEELTITGSEKAFIRLKTIDPDACINTLYALEGAIQGIRWHGIDKQRKQKLLEFFKRYK